MKDSVQLLDVYIFLPFNYDPNKFQYLTLIGPFPFLTDPTVWIVSTELKAQPSASATDPLATVRSPFNGHFNNLNIL